MTRPLPDAPIETPWQGRYIAVRTKGSWEYVSRTHGMRAAVILPLDESDPVNPHVILVEQYRVPLGRPSLELSAGLVGDDQAGEDDAIAAKRELEEETGYRAARWEQAGEFFSSPGMVSEGFTLFIARDLTKVSDGGGVNDENIIVHRIPLADVQQFVAMKRREGCAIDVRMLLLLADGFLAR